LKSKKKKERDEILKKKMIDIHDDEEDEDEDEINEKNYNETKLFLPENLRYNTEFLMFPCIETSYKFDGNFIL
jgi:hypothetical protein